MSRVENSDWNQSDVMMLGVFIYLFNDLFIASQKVYMH